MASAQQTPEQRLLTFIFVVMFFAALITFRSQTARVVDGEAGMKAAEKARIEACEQENISPCPPLRWFTEEELEQNLEDFAFAKEADR